MPDIFFLSLFFGHLTIPPLPSPYPWLGGCRPDPFHRAYKEVRSTKLTVSAPNAMTPAPGPSDGLCRSAISTIPYAPLGCAARSGVIPEKKQQTQDLDATSNSRTNHSPKKKTGYSNIVLKPREKVPIFPLSGSRVSREKNQGIEGTANS